MITIWKYELKVEDEQVLKIPAGATFLFVKSQHDIPCLWVRVASEGTKVNYLVTTKGTGHECRDVFSMSEYIGSYLIRKDSCVGHVWARRI